MTKKECIKRGTELKDKGPGSQLIASYYFFAVKDYKTVVKSMDNYHQRISCRSKGKASRVTEVFHYTKTRNLLHRFVFNKASELTDEILEKRKTKTIAKISDNFLNEKNIHSRLTKDFSWYLSKSTPHLLEARRLLHKK